MPTMAKAKATKKTNTRGQYHAKTVTIGDADQKALDEIKKELKEQVGAGVAYSDSMVIRGLIQHFLRQKKQRRVQARDLLE